MEESRVAKPITAQTQSQPADSVMEEAEQSTSQEESNSTESDKPVELPQEPWQTSPLFYEMANFLGVDSRDYEKSADQISVVTDWAMQQANSNKIEDIFHTIRDLEHKLQPPPWGERRVAHLYRALRMEARYQAAKKALGAFTKTGKWN